MSLRHGGNPKRLPGDDAHGRSPTPARVPITGPAWVCDAASMEHATDRPRPQERPGPRAPGRRLVVLLLTQLVLAAILLTWVLFGRPFPTFEREAGPAGGAASAGALAPRPTADRFDGRRAFAFLRRQVEHYGPRPAGSQASRALARELRAKLPNGRFEAVPGGLRNVVGSLPGAGEPIVVGAHYDTEATVEGHLGANDGAAGTAAVVELARALRKLDRGPAAPPIRFVLFDGEEEPRGAEDEDFLEVGLRGSKADVARHGAPRAMVLLDYIAEKRGLSIPREQNSDPGLWTELRAAASRVGTGRLFAGRARYAIADDHWPYLQLGVPAIDLIDFDYPQRDSQRDDMSAVSERSLDAVGETVLELLRDWPDAI